MAPLEIKYNEVVLARYIPSLDAWGDGLQFFSSDQDFLQVGTWNYDQGKKLLAHKHNHAARNILWTQEVLYVRSGCIQASIYNCDAVKVHEINLFSGDILILLNGGHGYEIIEDGTQVLEVKNGPYVGANADRTRL